MTAKKTSRPHPLSLLGRVTLFKKTDKIIKRFTKRWDVTLSKSSPNLELEKFLKKRFDDHFQNIKTDEVKRENFIRSEIETYTKHSIEYYNNNHRYVARGYQWCLIGNDLKLKDFLLFKLGTNDEKISGTPEANIFIDDFGKTADDLLLIWEGQEKSFLQAAKGWAYAAYVDYIQQQANNEYNSLQQNISGQEQPNFKNNFDNISPVEIYKHFKAGLVDKKCLTEIELIRYLKAAFELKTIPETLFKIRDAQSKEKIYLVFYIYYINVAGKPHYKQQQYVELLGNYFEGFNNETIKTNWARGYNPKKH